MSGGRDECFAAKPLVIEQFSRRSSRSCRAKKSKCAVGALAKSCPTLAETCSTIL